MGRKKERSSSGEIELSYSYRESGSSHMEHEEVKKLIGSKHTVVLETISSSTNYYEMGSNDSSKVSYEISVQDLIKLI